MTRDCIGIDFFCGCGGMTAGLLSAGVDVRLGIDIDPTCRETYEQNNKVPFACADVRRIPRKTIVQALHHRGKRSVMFSACAPCQPFSKVRKTGAKRHADTALLLSFLEHVIHFLPDFVICENVPQLAHRTRGRAVLSRFIKALRAKGYSTDCAIVDAADFDVPQHRRRLVVLAARDGAVRVPEGKTRRKYRTVREAIADLPALSAGESCTRVTNHAASALAEINLRRIDAVPADGGDLRSVPRQLRPNSRKRRLKYGRGGFIDVYGRMRWDAPAPTLTTRCNSLSNGRYGHPEQRRAISLREAARLQSFPDSFVFHVRSVAEGARLVGNAVPVSLARSLALSLLGEHRQSPQSDSAEKKSKPSARARSTTTGRSRVSVR